MPLCPTSSAENTIGARINRLVAVMPAAVPTATARVGDRNQISVKVASATPKKTPGKDRPAPVTAAEADRVPDRLRHQQDENALGRRLTDQVWDLGLAGEQDVLRAGSEPLGDLRQQTDRESATEQQRRHAQALRAPLLEPTAGAAHRGHESRRSGGHEPEGQRGDQAAPSPMPPSTFIRPPTIGPPKWLPAPGPGGDCGGEATSRMQLSSRTGNAPEPNTCQLQTPESP